MILKKLFFISSAVILASAFLFPFTFSSLVLAWIAVLFLVIGMKLELGTSGNLILWGMVLHAIAFYWLPGTIELFGGFSWIVSYGLFLLFCFVSSLQFFFLGLLYRWFSRTPLHTLRLSLPCSWLICEFICPRLFPWALANTQIVWTSFASLAELFGVIPLGFVMLWWGEGILWFFAIIFGRGPRMFLGFLVLIFSSIGLLFWGAKRTEEIKILDQSLPQIMVGLVQGNLSTYQKGDVKFLQSNLKVYQQLSSAAQAQGAEILLWPESIFNLWIPEETKNIAGSKLDPFPERNVPMLFGGLTYRKRTDIDQDMLKEMQFQLTEAEIEEILFKRFNSAIGIDSSGQILGMYHKRILMPFGEYLPFAQLFPWVKNLSPHTGSFDFGDHYEPINFSLEVTERTGDHQSQLLPISSLICYEDLDPGLTREAVQYGAKLLVNLTNDAWYGDTAAPDQHHLLASWRAVESRRYFVRATNTGLSGIISPLGQTIAVIPKFKEAQIVQAVKLFKIKTLYSTLGDLPVWIFVGLILGFSLVSSLRAKTNSALVL